MTWHRRPAARPMIAVLAMAFIPGCADRDGYKSAADLDRLDERPIAKIASHPYIREAPYSRSPYYRLQSRPSRTPTRKTSAAQIATPDAIPPANNLANQLASQQASQQASPLPPAPTAPQQTQLAPQPPRTATPSAPTAPTSVPPSPVVPAGSPPAPQTLSPSYPTLIKHASELLRSGDVKRARSLLMALRPGVSGEPALELARSFDPGYLSRLPKRDAEPDLKLARDYYVEAAHLGAREAETALERLQNEPSAAPSPRNP